MSLLDHESREDIDFGSPLYAGGRRGVLGFVALSSNTIDRIPKHLRQTTPCSPDASGVDIHRGTSERNFNGSYTCLDFTHREFLFSICSDTAAQYLPRTVKFLAKAPVKPVPIQKPKTAWARILEDED